MQLTEITHCLKTLDFGPRTIWPSSLPAVAWRGQLLCGFDRTEGPALNYEGDFEKFAELLNSCYKHLTLPELARLFRAMTLENPDQKAVLTRLGFRASEDLVEVLAFLPDLPKAFQTWVEDKDLSLKDLQILRLSKDRIALKSALIQLAEFSPSKTEGVQALEWIVELHEQGRSLPPAKSWSTWFENLKFERMPLASDMDLVFEQRLEKLAWPQNVQGKWSRRGDQSGVEIKMFVKSQAEADKKIAQLKDMKLWS